MMNEPAPAELAARIVAAAGHPDAIAGLLAEDVTWWITPSVPDEIMHSVTRGRDAVLGNLRRVFSLLYDPGSVHTTVHHAISQGNLGAIRWSMTGTFATGGTFENEYSLWVEVDHGLVTWVWEYTDVAHSMAQLEAGRRRWPPAGGGGASGGRCRRRSRPPSPARLVRPQPGTAQRRPSTPPAGTTPGR
jgi:ketosteroid isomerase-like protein